MNGEFLALFEAIKEFQEEKWKNHDLRADNLADKVEKLTGVVYETQKSVLTHYSKLPCEARKRDLVWLRIFGFGMCIILFWLIRTR